MAQHGKDTGIALAHFDITRWCNEVSGDRSFDVADASCFDEPQGAKVYVAGQQDATYSYSGREQGTLNSPTFRATIEDLAELESGVPFTVGIQRGFHFGRICEMGSVLTTSINTSAPVADVVSVSGDLQSDGPVYTGVVLTKKLPYTATEQGQTATLLGVASSARIHYHVVENTRNGPVTITVQHSSGGGVWVDYNQFIVAAGEVLAAGRTINTPRQAAVRVVVSLGGTSGSATIRVAITR